MVTTVPPMLVRAQIMPTGTVQVPLAVSNEAGTEPLIIRRGDIIATMTRVPHGHIQHGQHAQWAPSTDNTDHTLSNSGVADNVSASVTKSTEEEQRQEEKNLIWSMIHDQSGRDIVKMVKAGTQIGSVSFTQWKHSVE